MSINLAQNLYIPKKSSTFAAENIIVIYFKCEKCSQISFELYYMGMMTDVYSYTAPEIVTQLGEQYRKYRMLLGMTQKEVAEKAGLSVMTLQKFESGTSRDVSLTTIIRLWRVIGQLDNMKELLPEIPDSPYISKTIDAKRVRK